MSLPAGVTQVFAYYAAVFASLDTSIQALFFYAFDVLFVFGILRMVVRH